MADSTAQDRNLPASERKLAKAREEGRIARSPDLGHFAAMAVGGALLVTGAPWAAGWLRNLLRTGLHFDLQTVRSPAVMGERLVELTLGLLWVVVPFGVAMVAAAVAGSVATGGWAFTWKPMLPNFGKLDPLAGLMRMVSKARLTEAAKGCVLTLVLGSIGAFYVKAHVDDFTGVLALPLPAAIEHASRTLVGGMALLLVALALFALIDVPLQRYHHAQSLRMSRAELKQEHKEQEGSGEVKAKIRARMREITQRRMMAAVPLADLVVMNPTHYAVALKYDDDTMAAPRVVAKGADLIAWKIRDVANLAHVPVLQAPVLARALYAHAELDREIPAALFAAVAQVLAYVYQLRAALAGHGAMPQAPSELPVPAELDPHRPGAAPASARAFDEDGDAAAD